MKNQYDEPTLTMILLTTDVIATSGITEPGDGWVEDWE